MEITTDELHSFLLSQGLKREGIPFVWIGYSGGNLEVIVVDEEYSFIEPVWFLKNLGDLGYYETAIAFKKWVEQRQSNTKMG